MMTLSTEETAADQTQSCLHEHTKCLHCGVTFREEKPVTASEKRRNLSSGTYFGTFMKSIDETATTAQSLDEESIQSEDGDSVNEFSSTSRRCSYLVKYSVNGILKGQTRLSYDQDETSSELKRQSSLSSSSSVDVFDENLENETGNDDEIDEIKDEGNDEIYENGGESSETTSISEDIYDENEIQEVQNSERETEKKKQSIENEDVEKPMPQIEKKRHFSVKKQHSLDEYRSPGRKTSSKMQEKLSLFC